MNKLQSNKFDPVAYFGARLLHNRNPKETTDKITSYLNAQVDHYERSNVVVMTENEKAALVNNLITSIVLITKAKNPKFISHPFLPNVNEFVNSSWINYVDDITWAITKFDGFRIWLNSTVLNEK